MASIGHVVVGCAAARLDLRGPHSGRSALASTLVWSALSLLPDADIVGFLVGVPYEAAWGHRGATHSFVFAGVVGLLAFGVARLARIDAPRTALLAFLVVASHPLLDTLTDGGLGCALLWPFSHERFFAPWRPLPVALIGPAFFSREGLRTAGVELLAFSPLLVYAAWPIRSRQA